jgi:hypothetical protein
MCYDDLQDNGQLDLTGGEETVTQSPVAIARA